MPRSYAERGNEGIPWADREQISKVARQGRVGSPGEQDFDGPGHYDHKLRKFEGVWGARPQLPPPIPNDTFILQHNKFW
jgi:hypothetical protein